jgi:SAM-dependent methyltransferase
MRVWSERPLTREIYRRYFEYIAAELAPGKVHIELGGGAGISREFMRSAFVSDIVSTPFVHLVCDAIHLPLENASADNLFMVDVLHHIARPAALFAEITRVLRPGGRLVMVEPYISPVSGLAFRLAHPEPVVMSVDPLPDDDTPVFEGSGPFASNQAIPTLIFFRHARRFQKRFPQLRIRRRQLDSTVAYPLSGGFSGPCLAPRFTWPILWTAEALSAPLRRLLAFRLLVTLERV